MFGARVLFEGFGHMQIQETRQELVVNKVALGNHGPQRFQLLVVHFVSWKW